MAGFVAPIIGGIGSIVGGFLGAGGAKAAGKTIANAGTAVAGSINKATGQAIDAGYSGITEANDAINTHTGQANNTLADVRTGLNAQLSPYLAAGEQGVNSLAAAFAPGGSLSQQFSFNPSDQQNDPGYQFQLKEGLKAIQNSASARGLSGSGGTMKSLGDFSQGLAGTSFQNSYNRALQTFQTNHQNTLAGLTTLAGIGQNANQQSIGVNENYGNLTSGNLMSAGNTLASVAQQGNQYIGNVGLAGADKAGQYVMQGAEGTAAGQVGSANAWQSAINGVTGAFGSMFGGGTSGGGGSPSPFNFNALNNAPGGGAPGTPYYMPAAPLPSAGPYLAPTLPNFINPTAGMGPSFGGGAG